MCVLGLPWISSIGFRWPQVEWKNQPITKLKTLSPNCLINFCPCPICPRSWPTECRGLAMVRDMIVVDLPSKLTSWLVWAVEFSMTAAAASVGGWQWISVWGQAADGTADKNHSGQLSPGSSNVKLGVTDGKGASSMKLLHRMACVGGVKPEEESPSTPLTRGSHQMFVRWVSWGKIPHSKESSRIIRPAVITLTRP